MNKLEKSRERINEIDKKMAALFEERMLVAEDVAAYKKENGLPIFDKVREEAIIKNNSTNIQKDEILKHYINFQRNLMSISRKYQSFLFDGVEDAGAHKTISINLPTQNYDIIIGKSSINKVGEYLNLNRNVLIVTDCGVPKEYAEIVASASKNPIVVTLEQGEDTKSFENLQKLCSIMLENGFSRKDCVVAVGGGVIGDLSGFAAASFMRGIDFYNIPTTILSQVDSSIGGKVAINFEGIKNVIGAFYQPKRVIIDPNLLKTLSKRQMANGLAEALKMSLTSDKELFNIFENRDILENLEEIIVRSLLIKKSVVEEDEKESGIRKILNFGHTIGHAIESDKFGELYHGECVALGMLYMCSNNVRERLIKILNKLNLPTYLEFSKENVIEALYHDKKSNNSAVSAVFVEEIGSCLIKEVSIDSLAKLL